MKALIMLLTVLLIGSKCFAQRSDSKDYQEFVRRFGWRIYYPGELMRNRKPTVCLIKIEVDAEKNVLNMDLSDSADSVLKVEFNKHRSELDTKPLISYLKAEYNKNSCTTYMVPLSFAMYHVQVPVQNIAIKSLYNYFKFNGKDLNGNVIFLDPIYIESSIPQR